MKYSCVLGACFILNSSMEKFLHSHRSGITEQPPHSFPLKSKEIQVSDQIIDTILSFSKGVKIEQTKSLGQFERILN